MDVKNFADSIRMMLLVFILGIPVLLAAVLFLVDEFSTFIWNKQIHH